MYYARQSVTLLAQVSAQLAAAGSPVPSTFILPPPFPDFRAAQSDVRVNIYWFMSLVFSLSAALGATLVQQWVREYVHVFKRYSHPLKCARIRQFLFDGVEGWKMEVVVNLVPALIHVSLFLFFLGLADSLFKINTATAVPTTTLIVICTLCYLFSIIAPVLDAQSPYQSPLSGLFWHVFLKASRGTYQDHGKPRLISTNMAEGRAQLAMAVDPSGHRKVRDACAIEWIVDDLTEDSELEPLVRNIPESFNSTWGKDVWKVVETRRKDSSGSSGAQFLNVVTASQSADSFYSLQVTFSRLDSRITRLLRTCTDPGAFSDETKREQRAHVCISASLSLVLSMEEYKWTWLKESGTPTMAQVLIYLGDVKNIDAPNRNSPFLPAFSGEMRTAKLDSTSSIRWTCMSMIVVRKALETYQVRSAAKHVINRLAEVSGEREGSNDEKAAKIVGTINKHLKTGWDSAASLHKELKRNLETEKPEDRLRKIVQEKENAIKQLDDTWNVFGWAEDTDEAIVNLAQTLKDATSGLLNYLPGAVLRWTQDSHSTAKKGTQLTAPYTLPHFIPPRLFIQRLWVCVPTLRCFSATGWGGHTYLPKNLADLCAPELSMRTIRELMDARQTMMETQLWRLQDLRSGGLVYSLELFIEAIKSSSKTALRELSSKELYTDTFDYLTRKRDQCSVWTERLLVVLLQGVLPAKGDPLSDQVPDYIVYQFLTFSADVLASRNEFYVEDPIARTEGHHERPDRYQCSDWTEGALVNLLQRMLPEKGDPLSDQFPEHIVDRFLTFLADVLARRKGTHLEDTIARTEGHRERPCEYHCSVWTEEDLVGLLERVLPPDEGGPSSGQLSQKVIDHFLTLLADVLVKKEGSHVKDAISQIKDYCARPDHSNDEVARKVLSKLEPAGT